MKTNLFLAVLVFCLLLSAYTDRRPVQKTASVSAPESSSEPLFTLRPEEITVIKIIDPQNCLLIHSPPGQPRAEATDQLLAALAQARIVRRFSVPSGDLSAYGLTLTARRIEVFGAGEHKLQTIEIGTLNPLGNAVYAKRTDKTEVLLIGGYLLTALDFALRQMPSANESACAE